MDGYRSARRQRGAIGVMSAVTLGLLLVFLALVADAGRLFLEQRRLQRVADLAALESSSYSAMCGDGSHAQALEHAQAGAARNGFGGVLGSAGGQVELGTVARSADGTRRVFSADPDQPQAVRVQVAKTVPASLVLGGLFGEQVSLTAEAVAQRSPLASISLGSGLLALDSNQSVVLNALLGALLGTHLNLDALGYQALAGAMINLLEIGENMPLAGVDVAAGTVEELLDADLSVAQLLSATLAALDGRDTLRVDVRSRLTPLLNAGIGATRLQLGDILQVQSPAALNSQALRTDLNALDLITAVAFLANRERAVDVSLDATGLLGLLGLGSLGLSLYVVEAPQIGIGLPGRDASGNWRTQVRTAQLRLSVKATLSVPPVVPVATVDLGLALDVAPGWAALESIDCGSLLTGERDVHVLTQPGIASLSLGTFQGIDSANPTIKPIGVNVLGNVAQVSVSAQSQVADGVQRRVSFLGVSNTDLPTVAVREGSSVGASLGNALSSLASSLDIDIKVLGLGLCILPVCDVLNGLVGIIGSLVSTLGSLILDPLLQLLGLQLGYVDIRLLDVQADTPRLML